MSATVKNMEDELVRAKAAIERAETVQRLFKNRDFRKLILEDFMVHECAIYACNSADLQLSPEARADSLGTAQAAGYLKRWFEVITAMGNNAHNQMTRREQELAEARLEEADEEVAA